MYTPIIQNRVMSCHGSGAVSYISNHYFHGDNLFSHLVGPSEQFGTHENFFCEGGTR